MSGTGSAIQSGHRDVTPRHNDLGSRWLRRLTWTSGVVVVVLVAALVVAAWAVRRPYPQTEGSLTLPGLRHDVTVVRDGYGVPQIYARRPADLFYAQGYVQAQDRFFEMDFRRHVTAGPARASCSARARRDRQVRPDHGLAAGRRAGARAAHAADPGVPRGLRRRRQRLPRPATPAPTLSLEYTVLWLGGLDYTPEPWTPVDSLAWLKAMAWDLRGNMDEEIERALVARPTSRRTQIGRALPAATRTTGTAPIVDQGAVVDGGLRAGRDRRPAPQLPPRPAYPRRVHGRAAAAPGVGHARRPSCSGTGDGIGSQLRGWSRRAHDHRASRCSPTTRTSAPAMPGIWYQMGLHCRTVGAACPFDVAGFTFSGLPGRGDRPQPDIAWGFTNLGPDVTDLYLEKVAGDTYLYDGTAARRCETRTRADQGRRRRRRDDHRALDRGTGRCSPTSSDELADVGGDAPAPTARPGRGDGYAVALRWTALTPGRTADAVFGIDRAHGLGRVPRRRADFAVRPEPRLRRHRRHTSATRRRAGSRSAGPGDGDVARCRAGTRVRLDGLHPVRRAAERARPRAAASSSPPTRRWSDRATRTSSAAPADYGYRSTRIRTLVQTERQARRVDAMAASSSTR